MPHSYPNVRRDDYISDIYHGVEIIDPYRWLEIPESAETKEFIGEQNSIFYDFMKDAKCKKAIARRLYDLWYYPRFDLFMREGSKYYSLQKKPKQDQYVLYVQDSLQAEPTVFLDPNELVPKVTLLGMQFSNDGEIMAYKVRPHLSHVCEFRFLFTNINKSLLEILKTPRHSTLSWTACNSGFFYCGNLDVEKSDVDIHKSKRTIYYHKIGTFQHEDLEIYTFEDDLYIPEPIVSGCGKYLIVLAKKGCKNNLVYYCPLETLPEGPLELKPIINELKADYIYVTNINKKFYFHTDEENATLYKIIEIDLDRLSACSWDIFIPEDPRGGILEKAIVVNYDRLVLVYSRNVIDTIQLNFLGDGKKILDIHLKQGAVTFVTGKRTHKEIFIGFVSFVTPKTIYRVDLSGCDRRTIKYHKTIISGLNLKRFEYKQVFYKSFDDTEIPMFLLHKKRMKQDGIRPCILFGYGGFGISIKMPFSLAALEFVEKFNGVFAIPNIRGGGEFGYKWHHDGSFANKQVVFDDFKHAALYMYEQKYTYPQRLAVEGWENGGLVAAACCIQHPELYGALICHSGIFDMLRYHNISIGYALSTEFGCSDYLNHFKYLIKYSPLHNVHPAPGFNQFPATLLLVSDEDDRIPNYHSLKFIAELQYKVSEAPHQENPLMLRVNKTCHFDSYDSSIDKISEIADVYAFLWKTLHYDCDESTDIRPCDMKSCKYKQNC